MITWSWNKTKHRGSGVSFSYHLVYWNCITTFDFIWKTIWDQTRPHKKKKVYSGQAFQIIEIQEIHYMTFLYFHYWLLAPQWDLYDLHLITVVKMLMQHRRNIACSNRIILILNAISLLPFNPQIKTRCCHKTVIPEPSVCP